MEKKQRRVPVWMTCIIVLAMLPVMLFPHMLSISQPEALENKVLIWIYPFYVLVAGFLAWQCYGRRTEMTWILIVLLLLTHVGMYIMLTYPG